MRGIFKNALMFLLALTFAVSTNLSVRADDITAEEVRNSIKKGVRFLKGEQNKTNGSWDADATYAFDATATRAE